MPFTNGGGKSFKNIKTTFDGNGKLKKQKKGSALPKVLSVIAAFSLWLYVFQAVEYEKEFKGISVEIRNLDENMGIVTGFVSTVDLTFSGTKSVINELSAKDINAWIDLEGLGVGGPYETSLQVNFPGSAKLVAQSVSQLKISLDKTVHKTVDVGKPVLKNYNISYPYELGEAQIEPKSVNLTGPEADINKVASAEVHVDLGGSIKNKIRSNYEVKLYDKDGYEIQSNYILIDPEGIDVIIPVYKTASIPVSVNAIVDKDKYDVAVSPIRLFLKGPAEEIEIIDKIQTEHRQIDLPGVYTFEIDLPGESVNAYTSHDAAEESRATVVSVMITEKKAKSVSEDASGGEN